MKLKETCKIHVPRKLVWTATIEIDRWPQWTPTVQTVERIDEGPLRVGSEAFLKQPGMPKSRWRVTSLDAGRRFAWETRMRGMRIVATHELADCEAGTRNTLIVEMQGVATWLLAPLIWFSARKNLKTENAALKRFCESQAAGSGRTTN
ncbi:MAG: SRPBCC family protein [Pirellulales bacterium]|nr:SRPBCC family protein [Pirellulales bacterium]